MYWNAAGPCSVRISSKTSRNVWTGNVSAFGWPAANEMMFGFCESECSLRIAEKRISPALDENKSSRRIRRYYTEDQREHRFASSQLAIAHAALASHRARSLTRSRPGARGEQRRRPRPEVRA